MLCVRFCNKDHVLRQNCRKKVSSLWMGRLYRQNSRGDSIMNCPQCNRDMVWGHYIIPDGSNNWWCSFCCLIIFDEEEVLLDA